MPEDIKPPTTCAGSLHPVCSAIAHQNRRRVWEELEEIKTWTVRLEYELQKEPDGVIPWIQLQSISEATGRLLYAAGHVNAMRLAGASPNIAISDKP